VGEKKPEWGLRSINGLEKELTGSRQIRVIGKIKLGGNGLS